LFGDRRAHTLSDVRLGVLELRPHAVAPSHPLREQVACARFSADERGPAHHPRDPEMTEGGHLEDGIVPSMTGERARVR
jgi:hypothetical protein